MIDVVRGDDDCGENPTTDATVQVEKTQSAPEFDVSEEFNEHTYNIVYSNPGEVPVTFTVSDLTTLPRLDGLFGAITATTYCDSEDVELCSKELTEGYTRTLEVGSNANSLFPAYSVTLEPGQQLRLSTVLTPGNICTMVDGDYRITNTASMRAPQLVGSSGEINGSTSQLVETLLTNVPECQAPTIKPEKKVKDPAQETPIPLEKTRTYVLSYENTGEIDGDFQIRDAFEIQRASGHKLDMGDHPNYSLGVNAQVRCTENSTIPCPKAFDNTELVDRTLSGDTFLTTSSVGPTWFDVRIPAGGKLELEVDFTVDFDIKRQLLGDSFLVINTADVNEATGEPLHIVESTPTTENGLAMNDLAATVQFPHYPQNPTNPTVRPMLPLDIQVDFTNVIGASENPQFTIELPLEGFRLEHPEDISSWLECSTTGEAECPDFEDLSYDPETGVLSGTIPELRRSSVAGSEKPTVRFLVKGRAGVIPNSSYPVIATIEDPLNNNKNSNRT